jgi:hypothetical protein
VSYVLNQRRRGGCGHRGCGHRDCGHRDFDCHGGDDHRRRPCRDFDPRGCCDCATPPDCFEGEFFRDPIYRGPCPPDPEPCDRDWANNIYACCTQSGVLAVHEPGGRLPLESTCSYTSGAFLHCRGEFRLVCGGVYLVFVKIIVPANETLTTRLWLAVNGEAVPGTAIDIVKTTTGSSACYAFDAVVSADADDVLSIRSSNAFRIADDSLLASITLLKVN